MPSDTTFEQLYKRLRVWYPEVPLSIAEDCVNTALSEALSNMEWSGLRGYGEFRLAAPFTTGTVSVTAGSATVTGAGTGWTSALVGQQFFITQGPYYTVISVESSTSLTLDRVWAMDDATGQAYNIQTIYLTCPEDFLYFTSVVDRANRWRLRTRLSQEQLDDVDATRTTTGMSWVLAAATPSPVVATLGYTRFELWPRPTAPSIYPFSYVKRLPLLSADTDTPIFPLRGDVIFKGAMAQLCLYPGTSEKPNMLNQNLNNHKIWQERFVRAIEQAKSDDEDIRQTRVSYWNEVNDYTYAPLDARFMQTHVLL